MKKPLINVENLSKKYYLKSEEILALKEVDLSVFSGESLAIVGPSGSGKSTLLHLLGGLDIPTTGKVWFENQCINDLEDKDRTNLRRDHIGFIYQFHHLIPEFNVLENVMMPLKIQRFSHKYSKEKATHTLHQVGLKLRMSHFPSMLSGGERQRVAIARAVVTSPSLILADEPTGNLDRENASVIFKLLINQASRFNSSMVMVTHDLDLAKLCDRKKELL